MSAVVGTFGPQNSFAVVLSPKGMVQEGGSFGVTGLCGRDPHSWD